MLQMHAFFKIFLHNREVKKKKTDHIHDSLWVASNTWNRKVRGILLFGWFLSLEGSQH